MIIEMLAQVIPVKIDLISYWKNGFCMDKNLQLHWKMLDNRHLIFIVC